MAKTYFKIEGMDKLQRDLKELGKVPQKHVTASARKGMNIVLRSAKAKAPVDDGDLKKGIKLNGEKSKIKGKKVYQVIFDSDMNDIFQTKDKDGNINGYYPASQEYGFFAKNGRYIPGYNFMHYALTNNAPAVQRVMITTMKTKIDQEIAKAGLK
ncbi:MAG: HK97 gp10 family phage protein [Porphyromonadaceae bacterium]|nr:HK97 gp10 family phage protein [Porphyromonadaceae bacterium]